MHNYVNSDKVYIKKIRDIENDTMEIFALQDISKDEELLVTYNSHRWRTCFKQLI
jgi:hypothetical protein